MEALMVDKRSPQADPKRERQSPFAGDQHRGDYNPFDARNYDSGGFGFGGTSGSGGGYGVGGMGPQAGYASQAHAGQGYQAGDYDPEAIDDYFPDHDEPDHEVHRPHWTDSFPHSFTGWGPQAPEYGPDPAHTLGYTSLRDHAPPQDYGRDRHRNYAHEMERDDHHHVLHGPGRFRTRLHYDDAYLTWRAEEVRRLDADYAAWRAERRAKFSGDFMSWRSTRPRAVAGPTEDTGWNEDE
jgi:hypothetical protein